MKISKETVNILQNYASINKNLLIRDGNKLSTIAPEKNIISNVTLTDTFPIEFGIYDIDEFLRIASLFTDPDFEFSEKSVKISSGNQSAKYFAKPKKVLIYPEHEIKFPSVDVTFELKAADLEKIEKASSALKASDLTLVGDGNNVKVSVHDKKNVTSNDFVFDVGTTDKVFSVNMKISTLKLIPADYTVDISSKRLSRFTSKVGELVYFVAIESDSTFE